MLRNMQTRLQDGGITNEVPDTAVGSDGVPQEVSSNYITFQKHFIRPEPGPACSCVDPCLLFRPEAA